MHGLPSTYVHAKCRCDLCSDAQRDYMKAMWLKHGHKQNAKRRKNAPLGRPKKCGHKEICRCQYLRHLPYIVANYRSKRKLIIDLKDKPCMDCGKTYPHPCMDFDHRPGTTKVKDLSQMTGYHEDTIRKEAAKCDVVCSNCHRVRTYNRRHPETTLILNI